MEPEIQKPVAKGPKAKVASDDIKISRRITSADDSKRKQKIYTLVDKNGVWFKLRQANVTVFDPEMDQIRAIRYCPTEPSIYLDKQNKDSIREHVIFRDSILAVPASKANLQDYLDAHPDNVANGGSTFQVVNTEVKAKVQLDEEFLLHDAIGLIRDKDIEQLLPVALFLNIDIEQRNAEIKRELLLAAKANPKSFIELFDNPIVKSRSMVNQAIKMNVIQAKPDSVVWSDNGRSIVIVPAGQDPEDVLARYILQEKGTPVFEEIRTRLSRLV